MERAVAAVKDPPVSLLPPRATADGTHRRLLEVALQGFGERGFHGVSVRDIAEAAGIRPSSMYAHLSSKEQLLFELVLLGHQEHNRRLRDALDRAGPDVTDQIRDVVRAHVLVHAEYALLTRVSNRELHALGPANAATVMTVRIDSERVFGQVIDAGIASGAFRVDDAWLAVAAMGAMGIRVAEWWGERHLRGGRGGGHLRGVRRAFPAGILRDVPGPSPRYHSGHGPPTLAHAPDRPAV